MSKITGGWKKFLKKKKTLLVFIFAAGAGLVSLGIYSVKGTTAKGAPDQKMAVQETQAEKGNISNTIVGTGNLELEEGEAVVLPSGVIVDEVKVESGDAVEKGDVLAVVNQTSVLQAMESVQEQIDELDEKIDESRDNTESDSIKSKVDARVKKIFVQEGQEISECMMEQGALMLLSLDGYLSVQIETSAELAKGDTVTLLRSDGTQKEGTVDDISDGTCTILCSDSGVGIGEQVTAADTQGNTIGTGSTSIHQQLAVTAAAGTAEDICVSEDQKVYTDTTLLTVDHGSLSLECQEQMAQRQQLTDSLQTLIKLSQSGTLTAESAGIIQAVNISAQSSQSGGETENLQISKNTAALVGSVVDAGEENVETDSEEPLTIEITDSGVSEKNLLAVETPKTGKTPQTEVKTRDGSYEGTISWKPEDKAFAENTSYQANVTLSAGEGYIFTRDSVSKVKTGVLSGVTVSEDGKSLSLQITYPFTMAEKEEEDDKPTEGDDKKENGENNKEVDSENESGTKTQQETEIQNGDITGNGNVQAGNAGDLTQKNSLSAANSGGSSVRTAAAVSTQTVSQEESADTAESDSEVTAFTLAAAETMVLAVNVDELDINTITEGQEAEITLDAIEGESFHGTVTKVGNSASSSSGGVAKYTVKISIPKDERMKEGMNASAVITIEERENVVTIPVNALWERRDQVFVYTQADEEGNLSGEQEVSTGLSDGDKVEITEGLSEGDKVYYQKTGNVSQQSLGEENRRKGEQGEMPQGGFGGGRGEMPQGSFPGGESGSGMPGAKDRQE